MGGARWYECEIAEGTCHKNQCWIHIHGAKPKESRRLVDKCNLYVVVPNEPV